MAKTKVNWEDLFDNPPDWARQRQENFSNNDNKYKAQIAAIEKDSGQPFDDATRMDMLRTLRAGKPLNVDIMPEAEGDAAPSATPVLPEAQKPNFSNVESQVGSTEAGTVESGLETAAATLRDSLKSLAARGLNQLGRYYDASGISDVTKTVTGGNAGELVNTTAADIQDSANDPLRVARTQQLKQRAEEAGGVGGFVVAGGVDALSSPSSVLSLVGGPLGAVAIADAYAQAWEQGKAKGLEGAELEAWAGSQAAPELMSIIPAGKVLSKLPVVGPLIQKRVAALATSALEKKLVNPAIRAAVGTAKMAAGESIEEVATGSLQDLASAAFAGQEQAKGLQEIGQATMPQDAEGNFSWSEFGANRYRDARAAIVTAGAAGPLHLAGDVRTYNKERAAQNERRIADAAKSEEDQRRSTNIDFDKLRSLAEQPAPKAPTQPDLFGQDSTVPTPEEQASERQKKLEEDAAWSVRNKERAAEKAVSERAARVGELRDSIVSRINTEMDQVETLRDRVEAGDTSQATLASLTAAQKRMKVAEETLANFDKNFERKPEDAPAPTAAPAQAATQPVQEDLFAQQEAAPKAEADNLLNSARKTLAQKRARKQAADKAVETKRKKALAQQVAEQHADKTPEEQASILAGLIANPEAKPAKAKDEEPTVEQNVQGVINQINGLRKRKATARVNNRIRNLYRQDPTRTAKDIADILDAEEGTTVSTEETAVPTQEDLATKIANLRKKTGALSMEEAEAVNEDSVKAEAAASTRGKLIPDRTPEQQTAFLGKLRTALSNLGNDQESVDIHNLIKQGKLVITDNAASIGMVDTGGSGKFVPSAGKMFVYLDKIDPKKPKAGILAAIVSHEAGHAGQFNQREGRDSLFKYLLGSEGNAAANAKIRQLAKGGNKIAIAAVASAEAAAKKNKTMGNIENIELVPYVFSHAKINSPGLLGKLVRDVKAAARKTARDKLGANLDFSLDEILSAADKVAGEIVKTDIANNNTADNLEMIYSEGSAGYNDPKNLARMYTDVDGKRKYVLTDKGASLTPDAVYRLFDDAANKTPTKLGDILRHDVLYAQHPAAANIKVRVVPDSQLPGYGQYDPETKAITLSTSLVEGRRPTSLKEGLLHEIQHWVQDATGRGDTFYDERYANLSDKAKEVEQSHKAVVDSRNKTARDILDNTGVLWANASAKQKEHISKRIVYNTNMTDVQKVNDILDYLNENSVPLSDKASAYEKKWSAAQKEYRQSLDDYNIYTQTEKFSNYFANINEGEAFLTQNESNKSQEELDARGNPQQAIRDVNRDFTEGRIDVPTEGGTKVAARGLDMAAEETTTKAANPKFSVGERLNRILSHGRQERLEMAKIAEDLHTQFVQALKADTGNVLLSKELNDVMSEFLSSDLNKTEEGRQKLIDQMAAEYPAVTKVLVEARDRISDATVDIISEMVNAGRPLSMQQRQNIATMLANKDTYLSRAYAAFQGERGRKWAQTRWTNFYKNIGSDLESITNPKVKANVAAVRDAIKAIVEGLRIPDTAVMQDMTMDQLVSLASRYGIQENRLQYDRTDPDASYLKRDELITRLEQAKKVYPEGRLEEIAMEDAKSLLGLGNRQSNYAKQLSELAKNPGTLIERKRVPLEIRKLLGEIELAPGVFMATMTNQAALKARATVISELINDPKGDLALTHNKYFDLPEKQRRGYTLVNGEEWGALDGMYLKNQAYARLNEAVSAFYTMNEAIKMFTADPTILAGKLADKTFAGLGAVNRLTKKFSVVYNPVSWIGNYSGSFLNMVGAGNFSPFALKEGKLAAWNYVGGTFNTTTTPRLNKVIRYLNLEAADISELQKVLGDTLENYFDGTSSFADANAKLNAHAVSLPGRLNKATIAGYAIADNWSKIANFYHRYAVLKAVYDSAGINKTEHEILQEAGDDTSYTNISPERVNKLITKVEGKGLTQYAPYFAEVIRTRYTNFALGVKDRIRAEQLYKDGHVEAAEMLARHATFRMLGHIAVTAMLPAVGAMKIGAQLVSLGVPAATAYAVANLVGALGGDDEDNKLKRRLLPDTAKYQDLIQAGKNENNFPVYFPFSQKFDPNGPVTDLMRIMVYSANYREAADNLSNYAVDNLLIIPNVYKDIWRGFTADKVTESDIGRMAGDWKRSFVETTGVSADTVDRYLNVADNFLPGIVRAYKTQNTPDGVVTDPKTAAILTASNLAGFRYETFDPRRSLKFHSSASKDLKKANKGKLHASLLNLSADPTEKVVMDAAGSFFDAELKRQTVDYDDVRSLRAWKFTPDQVAQLLKDGGYTAESIPTMMEGNANIKISVKDFLQYAESSSDFADSRDRQKRKERAVKVANMLIELTPKLEKLGIEVETKIPKEWQGE